MSDLKLTTIYLNTFENFVSSVLLQPVTWIEISRKKNISCFDGIGNRISWRWSFLERGQFRFFLCSLCLDFLVGRLSIRFIAQIQSRVVVPYLWLCIFLENVLRTEKNMAKYFCFTIPLFLNVVVDSSRSCRHFSFLNKFECLSWQIQRFWSARHNLGSSLNAKVSC